MIITKEENNTKYFFLSQELPNSQIFSLTLMEKLVVTPEGLVDNSYKKRFIKKITQKGVLDDLLTPYELKNALKGILPNRLTLHHYIPKCLGGLNEDTNLCIMDRQLHNTLHNQVWDKVKKACEQGKSYYIYLPPNKVLFTAEDCRLFFTPTAEKNIKKIAEWNVENKHDKCRYRNHGRGER